VGCVDLQVPITRDVEGPMNKCSDTILQKDCDLLSSKIQYYKAQSTIRNPLLSLVSESNP